MEMEKFKQYLKENIDDFNQRYGSFRDYEELFFKEFANRLLRKYGPTETRIANRHFAELKLDIDLFERTSYLVVADVVYSEDKKHLIKYDEFKPENVFEIPDFVEVVDDRAVTGTRIKELILPDTVKHLGREAFADNYALAKVTFGAVQSSGQNVFCNCKNLKAVEVASENNLWYFRGDNDSSPFIYGARLYVNGELRDTITVPEEAGKSINLRSFNGCKSIKHIHFSKDNASLDELLYYTFIYKI